MKKIGHTILRLDVVPSTNTLLMESEEYLQNHGLVAIARHQTAGRGRLGRSWQSRPDSQLQFSAVLHPGIPREQAPLFSLAAGLAVAEALERALALRPTLKWPNDVYLGSRKVCGILTELSAGPAGEPRLVVGIGINCRGAPDDFPPEVREVLTTLAHETGRPVDMEAVFGEVLERLQAGFDRLNAGDRAGVLADWSARAPMGGLPLKYPTADGPRHGKALGLSDEGYLLIETAEGARHVHVSGEIEWV